MPAIAVWRRLRAVIPAVLVVAVGFSVFAATPRPGPPRRARAPHPPRARSRHPAEGRPVQLRLRRPPRLRLLRLDDVRVRQGGPLPASLVGRSGEVRAPYPEEQAPSRRLRLLPLRRRLRVSRRDLPRAPPRSAVRSCTPRTPGPSCSATRSGLDPGTPARCGTAREPRVSTGADSVLTDRTSRHTRKHRRNAGPLPDRARPCVTLIPCLLVDFHAAPAHPGPPAPVPSSPSPLSGLRLSLAAAEATTTRAAATDSPTDSTNTATALTLSQEWPLTGEPVDGDLPDHPVYVVKIDNTSSSAPQVGLGSADMVIEELVEGGLTRLAVFFYSDVPDNVGPVRSMRATDVGIVKPARGEILAAGGARPTRALISQAHIVNSRRGIHRLLSKRSAHRSVQPLRASAASAPTSPARTGRRRRRRTCSSAIASDFAGSITVDSIQATFSAAHTTEWTHSSRRLDAPRLVCRVRRRLHRRQRPAVAGQDRRRRLQGPSR